MLPFDGDGHERCEHHTSPVSINGLRPYAINAWPDRLRMGSALATCDPLPEKSEQAAWIRRFGRFSRRFGALRATESPSSHPKRPQIPWLRGGEGKN